MRISQLWGVFQWYCSGKLQNIYLQGKALLEEVLPSGPALRFYKVELLPALTLIPGCQVSLPAPAALPSLLGWTVSPLELGATLKPFSSALQLVGGVHDNSREEMNTQRDTIWDVISLSFCCSQTPLFLACLGLQRGQH